MKWSILFILQKHDISFWQHSYKTFFCVIYAAPFYSYGNTLLTIMKRSILLVLKALGEHFYKTFLVVINGSNT
jgi:hypothetical protein